MSMMKRSREDFSEEIAAMATNYLMLLSSAATAAASGGGGSRGEVYSREFTCKTCNRQFSSFQALGGHRASHKKPRLMTAAGGQDSRPASPPKPKTHECSVCGMEFPIGQALGGHMRRHRAAAIDYRQKPAEPSLSPSPPPLLPTAVVKNSRRVLCMDLNLTPMENTFVFGKIAPTVDCFF